MRATSLLPEPIPPDRPITGNGDLMRDAADDLTISIGKGFEATTAVGDSLYCKTPLR